ncbi:hypothetical protein EJ07DRAFT_99610 [Lizonia empirigonia]|nr:hypothetical protein EJ07DRAFT_99610 [Lizonia empirigonia]
MAEAAPTPQGIARPPPQDGPFVLRKLVSDLPLSADGEHSDARITCVEVWDGNLYVGTSAAEILHFVLLPPESNDPSAEPTAIIASRLEPPHNDSNGPGVQQILILPKIYKACVLCNNTLSIYSLPELSPDSTFKPISCLWVGGVDLNEDEGDDEGMVVVIGLKKRLRLVQVTESSPPKAVKSIEYGGCLVSVRRETFSCAADSHSYALLDVMHQQKIGLFPISSLDPDAGDVGGAAETIATAPSAPSRSVSSAGTHPHQGEHKGRNRSTSLDLMGIGTLDLQHSVTVSMCPSRYLVLYRQHHAVPQLDHQHAQPKERAQRAQLLTSLYLRRPLMTRLKLRCRMLQSLHRSPHIASPNPNEFLLTVGTTPSEQGVGMFVNLDGDMCRGSIQFSSYPDAIVVDGSGIDLTSSMGPDMDAEEGYVLAAVHRGDGDDVMYGIEIQRWDVDSGGEETKDWLNLSSLGLPSQGDSTHISVPLGMRTVVQPYDLVLSQIGAKLTVQRLQLPQRQGSTGGDVAPAAATAQEKADLEFTERLSRLKSQNVVWAGNQIWWAVRNPLVTRLDSRLEQAQFAEDGTTIQPNRNPVERVLGDIRGRDPRNESEYLSLIYIRQKASVLLLMDVVLRTKTNIIIFENEKRITERALIEGEVDPRIVLSMLPVLSQEVIQGPEGIQISGGITTVIEQFLQQNDLCAMPIDVKGPFGDNLLHFVKRYLQFWKRRKGMASVTSDPFVFSTVDAALLHILLLLDQGSPNGTSSPGTYRAELNELVDREIECFDRAVELLEQFKRLYVLSRLYQSNCKASVKAAKVLATWKRILDGEEDAGGAFVDGENELRKYLSRIRDQSLVEEYGAWLANRNPKLGVQIFADDHSRVKFEPTRAVELLKEKAPGAVKEYLEYLVFGKKHTRYVNELIAFYLDTVIRELETNSQSRETLSQTYETYRILEPPKPTYHQFITDNAIPAEWWQARLRLLQLLGSNQPATSSYDVNTILTRLGPFEQELVPEMIILHGRQEQHQEALRLLTHGLGDFDTAISYCLYGYSSIFRPITTGTLPIPQSELPSRAAQSRLFNFLLQEFLNIDDLSQRIERTGELLERFGGWFDIGDVLSILPNEWSVDIFSGFLINSLRRLVKEKAESDVVKALSDAQNSQMSAELVVKREIAGPTVERVT